MGVSLCIVLANDSGGGLSQPSQRSSDLVSAPTSFDFGLLSLAPKLHAGEMEGRNTEVGRAVREMGKEGALPPTQTSRDLGKGDHGAVGQVSWVLVGIGAVGQLWKGSFHLTFLQRCEGVWGVGEKHG